MITLNPATTALVLIDLQKGILALPTAPYSAVQVLETAADMAAHFRAAGATVVLVRVGWSAGQADALHPQVDQPMQRSPGGLPAGWMELAPELAATDNDILITKRQWGAFYGTELDLQLRRRGIHTIVIGGIATNMGVESTARDAWERGYQLVFAEDATSALSTDLHRFAFTAIFPRLGLIRSTAQILAALPKD